MDKIILKGGTFAHSVKREKGEKMAIGVTAGGLFGGDVSAFLDDDEVLALRDYLNRWLEEQRIARGKKLAEEAGEEYCEECNGPCKRKGNIFGDEDDD